MFFFAWYSNNFEQNLSPNLSTPTKTCNIMGILHSSSVRCYKTIFPFLLSHNPFSVLPIFSTFFFSSIYFVTHCIIFKLYSYIRKQFYYFHSINSQSYRWTRGYEKELVTILQNLWQQLGHDLRSWKCLHIKMRIHM